MNLIILILSTLFGKEIKLIIDGTILRVAKVYRAQTRRIKRVAGKKFWVKMSTFGINKLDWLMAMT